MRDMIAGAISFEQLTILEPDALLVLRECFSGQLPRESLPVRRLGEMGGILVGAAVCHIPKQHVSGAIPYGAPKLGQATAFPPLQPPPILDSKELLGRLRKGDETAFDSIFRAWYPSLVRASESIVRSRAVAEEIVQDVMLELWKRRESLADDSSPQAYLFQSTRNRSLNHIRHARVERRGRAADRRGGSRPDATAHSLCRRRNSCRDAARGRASS